MKFINIIQFVYCESRFNLLRLRNGGSPQDHNRSSKK